VLGHAPQALADGDLVVGEPGAREGVTSRTAVHCRGAEERVPGEVALLPATARPSGRVRGLVEPADDSQPVVADLTVRATGADVWQAK
jgi:hypothetical protein